MGKVLPASRSLRISSRPESLGQAQIDHRDVQRIFVAGEQAFLAVGGHVDREALLHQLFAQTFAQRGFVLDHQGSHGSAHPSGGGVDTHA